MVLCSQSKLLKDSLSQVVWNYGTYISLANFQIFCATLDLQLLLSFSCDFSLLITISICWTSKASHWQVNLVMAAGTLAQKGGEWDNDIFRQLLLLFDPLGDSSLQALPLRYGLNLGDILGSFLFAHYHQVFKIVDEKEQVFQT